MNITTFNPLEIYLVRKAIRQYKYIKPCGGTWRNGFKEWRGRAVFWFEDCDGSSHIVYESKLHNKIRKFLGKFNRKDVE